MLVLPILSRICFFLLPVTVVGRPANPSSLGKFLDVRQSHHNAIEGFHGAAGQDLPARREAEDEQTATAAPAPPSGEMTYDIKARAEATLITNFTANATALSSGKTSMVPFDEHFGPLEVCPFSKTFLHLQTSLPNPPSLQPTASTSKSRSS